MNDVGSKDAQETVGNWLQMSFPVDEEIASLRNYEGDTEYNVH